MATLRPRFQDGSHSIGYPERKRGKNHDRINLAAALATNGKHVLLVDADPQAHVTVG